jgi:predicted DCC family thiol-disulfide oxidoreductase YuxK
MEFQRISLHRQCISGSGGIENDLADSCVRGRSAFIQRPGKMTEPIQIGDRLLVLFDGHCGLCNRAVRWLLRRDRGDRLRFAPSDSPKFAAVMDQYRAAAEDSQAGPETILVVRDLGDAAEKVLARSQALLALLRELPQPWPAVAAALGWIPRPLLDRAYRLVARWRYRIWGRIESCPVPTAEKQRRFV